MWRCLSLLGVLVSLLVLPMGAAAHHRDQRLKTALTSCGKAAMTSPATSLADQNKLLTCALPLVRQNFQKPAFVSDAALEKAAAARSKDMARCGLKPTACGHSFSYYPKSFAYLTNSSCDTVSESYRRLSTKTTVSRMLSHLVNTPRSFRLIGQGRWQDFGSHLGFHHNHLYLVIIAGHRCSSYDKQDTTAPTAPTALSATADSGSVALSWSPSADNTKVTGYLVYRDGRQIAVVPGQHLTSSDSGLSLGTTYSYTVKARDAAGNLSPASNTVSVTPTAKTPPDTTAPTVPTGLIAIAGDTQASLSWNPSTDNIGVSGYRIYRSGVEIAQTNKASYLAEGLINGTGYSFTVAAIDRAGNLSGPSAPASATPASAFTTLFWSDEFDGAAGTSPDLSNWSLVTGGYGWGNNELQQYTARTANVSLDGAGHLNIVARQETYTGPDNYTRNYTSGRLDSRNKFSAQYGRLEARLKWPAGKGYWPAFWGLGDNISQVGWPLCGEIDVMESLGHEPFVTHGTIHSAGGSGYWSRSYPYTAPTNLTTDYHVYGVTWTPNYLQWTLDGVPYGKVSRTEMPSGGTWAFDQNFHLILNLAVGGNWPGSPDTSTVFPGTLSVDWVRVYH